MKEKLEPKILKNDIKRKLVEKIWEAQQIKNYFYKFSGKHVGTLKNIKILKY